LLLVLLTLHLPVRNRALAAVDIGRRTT
jgi:hypothetical protein